jgi:hypothetical protein
VSRLWLLYIEILTATLTSLTKIQGLGFSVLKERLHDSGHLYTKRLGQGNQCSKVE